MRQHRYVIPRSRSDLDVNASEIDVAIIGAGPYGLSLSTRLTAVGVEHRIFGRPMQAWADMSPGMYLKSRVFATSIYTPSPGFDFKTYCMDRGLESDEPAAIADFARYGVWVQKQLVSHLEETNVVSLKLRDRGFELCLETGERIRARRVVNAIGLSYFERMLAELDHLPSELVLHTANQWDFSPFRGRHVVVIGAGQSALQAAALLHEHGADVEMCVRGDGVHFGGRVIESERSWLDRVRVPNSVLGHGRNNWLLQHVPMGLHHIREDRRVRYTQTALGPGGAWWLRDRVEGKFPVHAGLALREASISGAKVRLRFVTRDGGSSLMHTDHVVTGTGYEVNIDRISYLDPALATSIDRVLRAPRLSRHFESSVRGLFFVGPASAFSFGPLYRFVAGADYTTRVVSRRLARTQGRAPARVWSSDVQDDRLLAAPGQQ